MEISFDGVTVRTRQGKELLSSVSATLKPGTFTSLMGSSGSGKTTLLSTLSRRFEASLLYDGNVRYNGRKWNARDRRAISFVQQDDVMPTYLTVEDFLWYSARLRLDISDEERRERVEQVIAKLRLTKCRKTVIGDAHARGVSGGERKRTSIANELLTKPQVIFTDEPTSGLDSTLSNVVIEILKDLTSDGLTVVTTIHSPSSFIFNQFDNLIVLDEGKVFYRGPASKLTNFLSDSLGRVVPAHFNPADYLMDLLVLEKDFVKNSDRLKLAMAEFSALETSPSSSLSEGFDEHVEPSNDGVIAHGRFEKKRSSLAAKGKKLVRNVSVLFRPGQEDELEERKDKRYARSFLTQVYLLTSRLWQNQKKNLFTMNQVASTLGLSIVGGLVFFQVGYTEQEIFTRVALAIWLVGSDMYLSVFGTSFALQDDIPLVKKEIYDGSYSLAAQVVAKQLVMYPIGAFWSIIFDIIVMAFSGLTSTVGRAVLCILVVQAEIFLFQGVGFLLSAAVQASGLVVVAVVIVTYYFLFSGFFAPYSLMPAWYGWLRWPCFLQYPYQLIMRIVFGDPNVVYTCSPQSAYAACAENATLGISGDDILKQFDIDLSVATCILVTLLCGLGLRILAYICYSIRMAPPRGIPIEGGKNDKPTSSEHKKSDKMEKEAKPQPQETEMDVV